MICRCLRLDLVAGLGIALAMLVLLGTAASAQSVPTQTTLLVRTSEHAGQTQAHATVTVTDQTGAPASGIVAFQDGSRQLGSAVLNSFGQATLNIHLAGGQHTLTAVYQGDATSQSSVSTPQATSATSGGTPDFQVSVSSLQPSSTLTAGTAGTATVTITPVDNAALTTPMFITVSCSGLPDQASCAFTPKTVEIQPTTPTSCPSGSPASACPPTSSMVIQTVGPGTAAKLVTPSQPGHSPSPMEWAFLFPGVLGLGGLAWGTRRRRWLSRMMLLAALAVVTTLGTTACNPQYYYYNHGQPTNPPTPAGNYTVTVTAQSSNGITAITHSTTLAMTVK